MPFDLEKKSVMLAGRIFEMAGKCKRGRGEKTAREILDSGRAMKKMREIIKEQGGNPDVKSSDIKVGKVIYDYTAKKSGIVRDVKNNVVSNTARFAGAPVDKEAGIYLYVHEGDRVKKGDKLITIHANSEEKLKFAKNFLIKSEGVEVR
jgi:AMP phosphorylase